MNPKAVLQLPRDGLVWVARDRLRSVALIGAVSLAACVLSAWWIPVTPVVTDEFSYLLAADTFAHGRLTNPTHPMWHHFESFHIVHQPTYASKYPPGQGLFLAMGILLSGDPLVGVWISFVVMCLCVNWMLRAWLPARWALLGSLLVAAHPYLIGMWGHSYWGGAVTAIGGCLIFGGLPRLVNRCRVRDGLAVGLGAAVLLNTRPYEGLAVGLPAAVWFVGWLLGSRRQSLRLALRAGVVPITLVLVPTLAWMAYYNWRVTGDVLTLPYVWHEKVYSSHPLFLWQEIESAPLYRHAPIAAYYAEDGWPRPYFRLGSESFVGWLLLTASKGVGLFVRYLHWPLMGGLVFLPCIVRYRRIAFAVCSLVSMLVALSAIPQKDVSHYVAPGVCLFFLLALQGLRYLRCLRTGFACRGRYLLSGILIAYFVLSPLRISGLNERESRWLVSVIDKRTWADDRVRIIEQLTETGRHHLIIVHYDEDHDYFHEFVYNAADIESAKVVWARSMNAERDAKLIDFFSDRQVWDLWADHVPRRLLQRNRQSSERIKN